MLAQPSGRYTDLLLGKPRIDDVNDTVDGDGGLGNICRHDHFPSNGACVYACRDETAACQSQKSKAIMG